MRWALSYPRFAEKVSELEGDRVNLLAAQELESGGTET